MKTRPRQEVVALPGSQLYKSPQTNERPEILLMAVSRVGSENIFLHTWSPENTAPLSETYLRSWLRVPRSEFNSWQVSPISIKATWESSPQIFYNSSQALSSSQCCFCGMWNRCQLRSNLGLNSLGSTWISCHAIITRHGTHRYLFIFSTSLALVSAKKSPMVLALPPRLLGVASKRV